MIRLYQTQRSLKVELVQIIRWS